MKTLAFFSILFFGSLALADDFKTINGKEYKNVTVSRVEPDGIVIRTSSGILNENNGGVLVEIERTG
jgi:hypothetical protein